MLRRKHILRSFYLTNTILLGQFKYYKPHFMAKEEMFWVDFLYRREIEGRKHTSRYWKIILIYLWIIHVSENEQYANVACLIAKPIIIDNTICKYFLVSIFWVYSCTTSNHFSKSYHTSDSSSGIQRKLH